MKRVAKTHIISFFLGVSLFAGCSAQKNESDVLPQSEVIEKQEAIITCEHEWIDATCIAAKYCVQCSETNGMPLGHEWIKDSVIPEIQTCSRCNELTTATPPMIKLEQKLLGELNMYDRFEIAQTIDNKQEYRSIIERMVRCLADAFSSAELGTVSAQVAINGLVPKGEYEHLETMSEKMQAIYNYFSNTVSRYVTIEYYSGNATSVEITWDNICNFVDDAISAGSFIGNRDSWDINTEIKTLTEFSYKMNITQELAFALLATTESYDISWLTGNFGTMLDELAP